MKTMKRLLWVCIYLLFCISSWAEAVTIQLHDAEHETWEIDKRSVSLSPVATHDGGTICLYLPTSTEYFRVTVKDAMGSVVCTHVVTEPSQNYMFEINSQLTDGEYLLEIEIGDQYYYGNFSI